MEGKGRVERDEFRRRLKEEWELMWRERFDDRVKAEGVAVRDYPLLFMDRGFVMFATRGAKTPSLSEIVEFWAARGQVYAPDPTIGGWTKFIRTSLIRRVERRRATEWLRTSDKSGKKQQLKKGGRGWLHVE